MTLPRKRFASLVSLLMYVAVAAGAAEREAMRLCLAGEPCREFSCGGRVEPQPVARLFRVTSGEGARHHLGVLDAHGTTIACASQTSLRIRISAPRFPANGQVRIAVADDAQHAWDLVLRASDLRLPMTLGLAKAAYDVAVESEHYRTVRRTIRIGDATETLAIALEPLPILAGRVLERGSGAAVPGAVITTDVKTSAVADGTGSFTIESEPDRWPATMTVSAAGYADTMLAIPKARAPARLDDVFLSRGGSILVDATEATVDLREIELRRLHAGQKLARPFRRVAIDGDSRPAHIRFDRIEPGRYVVLARGGGPCEQHGETLDLREGEEKNVELRISPMRLRMRTTMDDEPVAGARITFESNDGHWSAKLETGADGEAAVPLWQAGRVLAAVYAESQMTIAHFESRVLAADEEIEWTIAVPSRSVRGRVVDSKTGFPVADAAISLRAGREPAFVVRTRSDSEGRFRFAPVPYGTHTLTAASRTHLQASMSYTFAAPAQHRDVTIRLDGGSMVRLRILDAAGAPSAGAIAMQYDGLVQTRMSRADESGVAEIIVPDGRTRDVYVVPRDGSFGIARVAAKPLEATMRLPRGTSRIEIRAESEGREPIPNVSVVMRYNRQLIPADVVAHFARIQGARTRSYADGRIVFDHMPPGLYEFWPAGSAAELQALAAGAGPRAPVSLTAAPGENVAVLVFARVP
jgi:hypothetical protein